MNRRDAIGRVALLMGGAVIGAEFFLSGCKPSGATSVADLFTPDTTAFLNEVADTILPDTKASPGAKAANVGGFMAIMVRDCYTPADQKIFVSGIGQLNDAANKKSGSKFMDLTPQQRTDLLVDLDKEQKAFTADRDKKLTADALKHKGEANYKAPELPNHYFRTDEAAYLIGLFYIRGWCNQSFALYRDTWPLRRLCAL